LASGAFGSGMEVEATLLQEGAGSVRDVGLVLQGPHATTLARVEMGTHLVRPAHEPAVVLQLIAIPLPDGADARATLAALVASRPSVTPCWSGKTAKATSTHARSRPTSRSGWGGRRRRRCGRSRRGWPGRSRTAGSRRPTGTSRAWGSSGSRSGRNTRPTTGG